MLSLTPSVKASYYFMKNYFYKNFNKATDIKICEAMLNEYIKGVPSANRPFVLDSFIIANNNDAKKMTDFLYANTNFVDKEKTESMLNDFEKYPQLHILFNEATKLAGAAGTKGTNDVAVADNLLGKIKEIDTIFWETKKA